MFGCDTDITLWSREKDKVTKKEVFTRVDVPVKCKWRWQSERKISAAGGGTGANVSDSVVIIVPYYTGLNSASIKPGDIISRGKHDTREEAEEASEVITVMKVAYNYGAECFCGAEYGGIIRGRHLRIEGK